MLSKLIDAGFAHISTVRGVDYIHYPGSALLIEYCDQALIRFFYESKEEADYSGLNVKLIRQHRGLTLCIDTVFIIGDIVEEILEVSNRILSITRPSGFTFLPNTAVLSGGIEVMDFSKHFDSRYYYASLKG